MLFYHNTTDAGADSIQAQGFRNGLTAFGEGVWFSDDPEYMGSDTTLTLEIPEEIMRPYMLEYEEQQPPAQEWYAPAEVVNAYLHTLARLP
jgi:hypothetical protein